MSINDTIFVGATATLEDPVPGNCYYPYTNAVSIDMIKNPLLVYPSPAIDYVIFETVSNIQGAVITITDIIGRPVATFPLTDDKTVWQTNGKRPGLYLYRLQTKEGSASGKLLIAP